MVKDTIEDVLSENRLRKLFDDYNRYTARGIVIGMLVILKIAGTCSKEELDRVEALADQIYDEHKWDDAED